MIGQNSAISKGRRWLSVLAWLAALAVALACDAHVARWVHAAGIDQWMHRHAWLQWVLRRPGNFYFTLIVAGILCLAHPQRFRAGALVGLSGIFSAINVLAKWIVGQTRPYHLHLPANIPRPAPFHLQPMHGGIEGLIHQSDLSFPSGDATLAFATAAALALLLPRWRWFFYLVASLVAAERVAENAHYVGDVVAGAILGILCAAVARRCLSLVSRVEICRKHPN